MKLKVSIRQLLSETFRVWQEDSTSEWSAAIAFYTVLSLAPTLVIIAAIAGAVFGEAAARGELVSRISEFVGPGGAMVIRTTLVGARKSAGLATILGTITLLFSGSAVFVELQTALNRIWRVPPVPLSLKHYLKDFVRKRLLSFLMIIGIGFLLLLSVLASTVLSFATGIIWEANPVPSFLLHAVNFAISLGFITVLFAMIYHFLPDARSPWSVVWRGALFTSLLFSIGRLLVAQLLGATMATSAYGAAGSFAAFLLWIYYCAQIFLLGAEFTYCYEKLTTESRAFG